MENGYSLLVLNINDDIAFFLFKCSQKTVLYVYIGSQ